MTDSTQDAAHQSAEPAPPPSLQNQGLANAWKALKKAPWTAKFGMIVILLYILVGIFAPWLTPYGESQIVGSEFDVWGEEFLLGTDNLGRDMLTRLFYGARNTIGIAIVTTCLSFMIGGVGGILAAALGGWTDQILSRMVDVLMAIPALIFLLLLLTIFGTSIPVLIVSIAILDSTRVFRLATSLRAWCCGAIISRPLTPAASS